MIVHSVFDIFTFEELVGSSVLVNPFPNDKCVSSVTLHSLQHKNLDSSKPKEFADDNFKLEMAESSLKG